MAVTEKTIISKLTNEFLKWVNYTEKTKKSDLSGRDYDNPGPYNEHAGYNNYTVFADLYYKMTGINVQGQAWCDTFVDTVFIHVFGVDIAKKLLGGFSAYTPTSANYFKNMGRWHTSPQPGDVIFFENTTRIYHTGYVYEVTGSKVRTVEGNTSTTNNVVEENGGCVAKKEYDLNNPKIAGYGRPDYSLAIASMTYPEGWMKAADNKRWWYEFEDGSYARDDGSNHGWYLINNYWYAFDANGYMLTGYQTIQGSHYYFNEDTTTNEGALMTTYGNTNGELRIWNTKDTPANTDHDAYVEGWIKAADGVRWWYQFKDGSYAYDNGKNDGIYQINGWTYKFDKDGYMLVGIQKVDGANQFFCPDYNSDDVGKLMVSYSNTFGGLKPWVRNDPREV